MNNEKIGTCCPKKLLYGTRSIEVADLRVGHYKLTCRTNDTQLVVDKPKLPYVEVKI